MKRCNKQSRSRGKRVILGVLLFVLFGTLGYLFSQKGGEEKALTEVSYTQEPDIPQSTVSDPYNGHEYVDMGLSVKWATCNVGAGRPGDYGNYYAWGETTTKSSYTENNSKTYGNSAYTYDIGGNVSHDVARKNWGGEWRLPTEEECHELLDNCTWEWTTQNGNNGYKVTSKKNGNSIFLPAAGYRCGTSLYNAGSGGYYWSSTPLGSSTYGAFCLYFDSGGHRVDFGSRDSGFSVRPVVEL